MTMRVAVIDLGTNSVRFGVYELRSGKKALLLHREKLMVRLGQGVFINGILNEAAIQRTIDAFTSFRNTANQLHVQKTVAFGTSALRESSNREEFIRRIHRATGIHLRVISGAEEARLIALGVLSNERNIRGRLALVDIGGGSTEISVCSGKKILFSESFPLGTARIQQVFLKTNPPSPIDLERLRRHIRETLIDKILTVKPRPRADEVMGSSGTIRTLAKILSCDSNRKSFNRAELRNLIGEMNGMSLLQLLRIPGMDGRRADMILGGAILFEECMTALGAKKAFVTEFSLRDGILEEENQVFAKRKSPKMEFHFPDLYLKAKAFSESDIHLKKMTSLSEAIFNRLHRLHKLNPQWASYFTAAMVLRDAGQRVSLRHHEKHSYYIIKNSDFPWMEPWESEFIALLCLYHEQGKIDPSDVQFRKDQGKYNAFLRLLALLRIANALDTGSPKLAKIRKVEVDRKRVKIQLSRRSTTDFELLRVERQKDLFEKVFKRTLSCERG